MVRVHGRPNHPKHVPESVFRAIGFFRVRPCRSFRWVGATAPPTLIPSIIACRLSARLYYISLGIIIIGRSEGGRKWQDNESDLMKEGVTSGEQRTSWGLRRLSRLPSFTPKVTGAVRRWVGPCDGVSLLFGGGDWRVGADGEAKESLLPPCFPGDSGFRSGAVGRRGAPSVTVATTLTAGHATGRGYQQHATEADPCGGTSKATLFTARLLYLGG
ncbi:hypothetical protein OPV22_017255 [Ensete ventricosum]|uniref:Uncharacterized protein n=1 Tax=Ensete ventricosum TaxID=4639 RepID=A0AAV8QZA3_ENSVE|nr:hypothetical protein OPV22_017255 [Ensete ventricosum]